MVRKGICGSGLQSVAVMRHCAWQMTHRHVRSDGKKQIEWPRGRPHSGQVSEFAEVNHFRDPQKADEWSLRHWRGTVMVSGGQYMGAPAGVRRCRSICRRPEGLRWVTRVLKEMIGDPRNRPSHQEEMPPMQCGVYTTPKRQIRNGGQKGCMACCRHAGVYSQESRTRSQDTVDSEAAQSGKASSIGSPGTNRSQFEKTLEWKHLASVRRL